MKNLPEKWAVERTIDNAVVLNNWANNQPGIKGTCSSTGYMHSHNYSIHWGSKNRGYYYANLNNKHPDHTEISFEDFEKLVLNKLSKKEKEENWVPKVGDWIVITKGSSNWVSEMNAFVGKVVKITEIENIFKVKFKGDKNWTWDYSQNHFRKALQHEILEETLPKTSSESLMKDILIEANRKFPIGTKFLCKAGGFDNVEGIVTKPLAIQRGRNISHFGLPYVYYHGIWATVISLPEVKEPESTENYQFKPEDYVVILQKVPREQGYTFKLKKKWAESGYWNLHPNKKHSCPSCYTNKQFRLATAEEALKYQIEYENVEKDIKEVLTPVSKPNAEEFNPKVGDWLMCLAPYDKNNYLGQRNRLKSQGPYLVEEIEEFRSGGNVVTKMSDISVTLGRCRFRKATAEEIFQAEILEVPEWKADYKRGPIIVKSTEPKNTVLPKLQKPIQF
jgi:hypothetical protein